MLITVLVMGYILVACVIGCDIYVYCDNEHYTIAGVFGGLFWPLTIVFIALCKLFTFICSNICKVFKYLKDEGFHYCKEDISPCCGQCKYLYYCNNFNESNNCNLTNRETEFCSLAKPCKLFKKHWLWRFKIRYNWNK